MSSSAKLSRPPMAQVQTTSDQAFVERTSHAACPHSQEDAQCSRFLDVAPEERRLDEASASAARSGLRDGPPCALGPLRLRRVAVCDLMTRNVVSVRPELCLESATALLIESGLEALPVVDAASRLLGFVSESALLREAKQPWDASRAKGERRTVGDLMTPCTLSLPESASITRAAALLAFERQCRLAVVSRTGKVVGVLSASDVLYWLARADGHVLSRPRPRQQTQAGCLACTPSPRAHTPTR